MICKGCLTDLSFVDKDNQAPVGKYDTYYHEFIPDEDGGAYCSLRCAERDNDPDRNTG